MEKQHIDDVKELYRRIHPNHIKNSGVTSAAFKPGDKESRRKLSVDVAEWTTPQKSLSFARDPDTKLAILIAGEVRRIDHQCVSHDPLPENCAHALIVGDKPDLVCKLLARSCSLLILNQSITPDI